LGHEYYFFLTSLMNCLEGRFVVGAAEGAGGRCTAPRVVLRGLRTTRTTAATATAAEATTAATTAAGLVDLGRGVAQRRPDLVDLELDDGSLLTLAGLERTLLEPPGDDHPRTA